MRSALRWSVASRRRSIFTAVIAVLLIGAASAYAWSIFASTVAGPGGAKATTVTSVPGLTLTPAYQAGDAVLDPGVAPGDVYVKVHNGSDTQRRIMTLTAGAITSDIPACDTTGISFTANASAIGASSPLYLLGTPNDVPHVKVGTISNASGSLDPDCSGANFQVALTGTTAP